jgi:hypothetical protein
MYGSTSFAFNCDQNNCILITCDYTCSMESKDELCICWFFFHPIPLSFMTNVPCNLSKVIKGILVTNVACDSKFNRWDQSKILVFLIMLSLIYVKGIVSVAHLGSYVLIVPNIACRSFLDLHLFVFKAIKVNNLSSLSFQAHLRLVHELLFLVVATCIPPFR